MRLSRRGLVEEGDERAENGRRNGAVVAAISILVLLLFLAGGVTLLWFTPEPVRVGSYAVVGPNVKKAGDLLIWFGNGPGPRVTVRALTKPQRGSPAPRLQNMWITPANPTKLPTGVQAYVSIPSKNGFLYGRLILDFYGFRLIGP